MRINKYSQTTTGYSAFGLAEKWENKEPFDCPECGEKTYDLRFVKTNGDKILLCRLCYTEMDTNELGEWDNE